jgi:hypothetical protein
MIEGINAVTLGCPCRKIKSGHIGDATRRELGDKECGRPAGRRAIAAHPSPETDGYAPRYDISCKRAVRDGDAARRALQHGRGIPVGPNRSDVQHIRFVTGNAETLVDRECPLIEVVG